MNTALFIAGGVAVLVFAIWLVRRTARSEGRTAAAVEQRKEAEDARKRMDAVGSPGDDGTVERLRRRGF